MADIFKPYNGKSVIKVNGVCYSFVDFSPESSATPGFVESEHDGCIICHIADPRHGYEECSSPFLRLVFSDYQGQVIKKDGICYFYTGETYESVTSSDPDEIFDLCGECAIAISFPYTFPIEFSS